MKITTIKYGRTYPLGSFASERIDCEATIDEGQDPHQALQSLKNQVQHFHESTNPGLYIQQQPILPDYNNLTPTNQDFSPPQPEPKVSIEEETAALMIAIETAENETELTQYQLLAAKNKRTMGAYNKRKKQLNIS